MLPLRKSHYDERMTIMHRSQLKTLYLKNKSVNSGKHFLKKQKKFCTNLLRKTKRQYSDSLDKSKFHNTKKIWKTM